MSLHAHSTSRKTVADLMTVDVVTIGPEASVRELARVLYEHGISGVPVMEGGTVIGVVSGVDVVRLSQQTADGHASLFAHERALDDYCVRDIMTPNLHVVDPSIDMDSLAQFFAIAGVHRALVLEGGALVGVVSLSDLLGALAGH